MVGAGPDAKVNRELATRIHRAIELGVTYLTPRSLLQQRLPACPGDASRDGRADHRLDEEYYCSDSEKDGG
jgi:hypothetical protein